MSIQPFDSLKSSIYSFEYLVAVPKDEIPREKLFDIMQKESRSTKFVKLDFDFYHDVNLYIQKMHEELYREIAKDPFSPKSKILNEEYHETCSMYKKIFENRTNKILKRAYVSFVGNSKDTNSLLKEEIIIYERIMQILEDWKEEILGSIEKNPIVVKKDNSISSDKTIPETTSGLETKKEPSTTSKSSDISADISSSPSHIISPIEETPIRDDNKDKSEDGETKFVNSSPLTLIDNNQNSKEDAQNNNVKSHNSEDLQNSSKEPRHVSSSVLSPKGVEGSNYPIDSEEEKPIDYDNNDYVDDDDNKETAEKKDEIEEKEDETIFGKSKYINDEIKRKDETTKPQNKHLENVDNEISILFAMEDLCCFVCPENGKNCHFRAKDVGTLSKTTAELLKRSGKVYEIRRVLWT